MLLLLHSDELHGRGSSSHQFGFFVFTNWGLPCTGSSLLSSLICPPLFIVLVICNVRREYSAVQQGWKFCCSFWVPHFPWVGRASPLLCSMMLLALWLPSSFLGQLMIHCKVSDNFKKKNYLIKAAIDFLHSHLTPCCVCNFLIWAQ